MARPSSRRNFSGYFVRSRMSLARSMGISEGTLWNWVKAERDAAERTGDPDALSESERDELHGRAKRTSSCASTPSS